MPIGSRFGRLTTTSAPYLVMKARQQKSVVDVYCECGVTKVVVATYLRASGLQSCGCLKVERSRAAMRKKNKGISNPNYKGRWWCNKDGYRVCSIAKPDGKRQSLSEHVLVMERHQGRPLEPWEEVHHIDSTAKTDNDHFCKKCGAEWPELGSDGLLHCECGWSAKSNLQLRITKHGAGSAYACRDCGSGRIHPVPLAEPDNRHIVTEREAKHP